MVTIACILEWVELCRQILACRFLERLLQLGADLVTAPAAPFGDERGQRVERGPSGPEGDDAIITSR